MGSGASGGWVASEVGLKGNLFLMDGAGFTASACQNPTLTIMALAWRACDYIVEQAKKGNL